MVQQAERIPPHNVEAERAVLGSMLVSEQAVRDAIGILAPEDFYRPLHQRLFFEMKDMYLKGYEVDAVSLRPKFSDPVESVYLIDLGQCARSSRVVQYAEEVKRDKRLRELIIAGEEIATMAFERHEDSAERGLNLVIQTMDTGGNAEHIASAVGARITAYAHPTEYFVVPECLVRLHYGDFTVLAARPGVGKTALAIASAEAWGTTVPVRLYSYEMSRDEIADRVISRQVRRPAKLAQDGLSEDQQTDYWEACKGLEHVDLTIVESAGMSLGQLYSSVKAFAAQGGKIAIVDYLQLAVEDTRAGRLADMSRFTKALMNLAKNSGCAVVALSQFSRAAAAEHDKFVFPQLHHLRDSGTIEQDAANVCLIAEVPADGKAADEIRSRLRGRGYIVDPMDQRSLLRLDWAKVRHGETHITWMWFDGDTMSFEGLDRMA